MWKTYLQIISFKPLLPSVGPNFLGRVKFHILISDIFLQKPQAGSGAEMNGWDKNVNPAEMVTSK